ncbi:hypothetical protein EPI10_006418 [Gossypium australe]|uniref:Uncharacterized protein n=1 Tax=Gossypium australe TaxID=47621 RepID=A0A5B6WR20_9ROSI|nr:hypothetical protein EPI10_006418 [Gossypium australe]
MQRIEYESLPNVCFGCGRFSHNQDIFPLKSGAASSIRAEAEPIIWNEDKGGDSGCNGGSRFEVLGKNKGNNAADGNIKSGKNIGDTGGKGIVVPSGLKTTLNILKPSNREGESSMGQVFDSFDSGSQMGPKATDVVREPIIFQAVNE